MFGWLKRARIKRMEDLFSTLQHKAKYFYNQKDSVEGKAFTALYLLADSKGYTAQQAARTTEGKEILSEVVLNRQYALYFNEQAIQIYAQLYQLKNGVPPPFGAREWLDEIVKPSGWEIALSEIDGMCGKLISDLDNKLKSKAD